MKKIEVVFLILFSLSISGCSPKKTPAVEEDVSRLEKTTVVSETAQLSATSLQIKPLEISPLTTPSIPATSSASEIPSQPSLPFQPTVIHAGLAVELVIDASGSMNGLLGNENKISIVRERVHDLVTQWTGIKEPPLHLGIRAFGGLAPFADNKCDDSNLLVPIATIDPVLIQSQVSKLQAQGANPTSFALQKAGEDLRLQNEDRVIILLTDGKDTCGQDPCAMAKLLYDSDKIVTHVIAFDTTQADEEILHCIANTSKGVFLLARTKEELGASLNEAIRSTIPYNLRLKVMVGGTPLPSTVTVYKAGTQKIVERSQTYGIELFRLDAGSYDILIEYSASIEKNKPSKILKGVSLTQTGKVEQEIRFDLGSLTLSAHNAEGKPAPAAFSLFKAGTEQKFADFSSNGEATTFYITPGTYNIISDKVAAAGQEMTLNEKNVTVSLEQGFEKDFAFQTGSIVLKGETSAKKPVALTYKVTKPGHPENIVAEGSVEKTGGNIDLPPGVYNIDVEALDPELPAKPKGRLENVAVEGGAIIEKLATLTVGTLNLRVLKAQGKESPAIFTITDTKSGDEIAKLREDDGKAVVQIPPGKYDVAAQLISEIYTEGPTTEQKGVEVQKEKSLDVVLHFALGTLKILGRNTKEQKLQTIIEVYEGGSEKIVAKIGPTNTWMELDLAPGNYDIKALEDGSAVDPKPFSWQRDITVEADKLYVREVVFTNAKLRLIGRGTNNEIIPVGFKIYKYGTDRPILSGTTGQDWQSFDIDPDQYYIEASYSDEDTSQLLKKWVTLKVGENEFVEKELRF